MLNQVETEVTVIGGGVIGASVTYHLAKAGRKVTLLNRGPILSGCSSSAHAAINVSAKEGDEYVKFSLDAARLYQSLESELDCDLEYRMPGGFARVVERESDWDAALRHAERLNRVPGVDAKILGTVDARELIPALPTWIEGAVFCPVDGAVNPFRLVSAYIRRARELGAVVRTGEDVRRIELKGNAIDAVVTPTSRVHSQFVINAAGVESPRIAAMVGVNVPLVPQHGQTLATAPVRPFLPYDLLALTQTASGSLLVGTTKNFIGYERDVYLKLTPPAIQMAVRLFPFLRNVPVVRIWAGIRPYPIDGLPIIGRVPGIEGLLMAACNSGYSLAQIMGMAISDLVVHGSTSISIDSYQLSRFQPKQADVDKKLAPQLPDATKQSTGSADPRALPVREISTSASGMPVVRPS